MAGHVIRQGRWARRRLNAGDHLRGGARGQGSGFAHGGRPSASIWRGMALRSERRAAASNHRVVRWPGTWPKTSAATTSGYGIRAMTDPSFASTRERTGGGVGFLGAQELNRVLKRKLAARWLRRRRRPAVVRSGLTVASARGRARGGRERGFGRELTAEAMR